jgi:hypothetical protein
MRVTIKREQDQSENDHDGDTGAQRHGVLLPGWSDCLIDLRQVQFVKAAHSCLGLVEGKERQRIQVQEARVARDVPSDVAGVREFGVLALLERTYEACADASSLFRLLECDPQRKASFFQRVAELAHLEITGFFALEHP